LPIWLKCQASTETTFDENSTTKIIECVILPSTLKEILTDAVKLGCMNENAKKLLRELEEQKELKSTK